MSYVGQTLPVDRFSGYLTETFTGDGSTTAFTLTREPHSESSIIVVINNVVQQPVEDYTISGTTLTIDAAVASGDVIYATHTGGVLPITESATIDLQGVSDALILDSDADTTISADTDDQIDFKAGGTDILSLTATTATFNDDVTITTAGVDPQLTLISTEAGATQAPIIDIYRNSSSPADADILGQLRYYGENSADEKIEYVRVRSAIEDVTDGDEGSAYAITTYTAGSQYGRLNINETETIFNQNSADIDFRVESNGDANCLFVNAGDDKVQIGGDASSDGSDTRIDLFNFGQMNIFRNASSDVFTIIFNNTNSGNISGSIRQNGDATAFNTSSDYRLKENLDYTWDATTRLKQLKPARFNWISDDTNTLLEGFLAHEVSSIVPQAVSGEKDKVATADDVAAGIASSVGDAIHQGIDQSKLVPLIVKTIQELEARITTLEG